MPLKLVRFITKEMMMEAVSRLTSSGYICAEEEYVTRGAAYSSVVVCVRRINEIQDDVVVLESREAAG